MPPKNELTTYCRHTKLRLQLHLSSSTNTIPQGDSSRGRRCTAVGEHWELSLIVGSLLRAWPRRSTLLKAVQRKGQIFSSHMLEAFHEVFFSTTPSKSLQLASHLQQMKMSGAPDLHFPLNFSSRSSFRIPA